MHKDLNTTQSLPYPGFALAGPSTGNSQVYFVGQFFNTSVVSARFGDEVTVNCSLINSSYAQCRTPPASSIRMHL